VVSRQSLLLSAALFASALTALVSGAAYASPEAGIDAEIRPRFGALLDPPYHRHHYDWDRRYHGDRGIIVDRHPYWVQSVTVDCGDPNLGPTPLNDALYHLAENGTLYIRGNTQACHESLEITRSVTISGEAPSAFAAGPEFKRPTIAAPDGSPCIIIDRGVTRVEIHDLVLSDSHGGGEACIEGWGGALALVRTKIDYAGDGSAVYLQATKLLAQESIITANTYEPAVVAEDSSVDFARTTINSASTGIELSPAVASNSGFDRVSIISQSATPGASAQTGLFVHVARGGAATVAMKHVRVAGFDTGLWFQPGVVPTLEAVKVIHSRIAVTSETSGMVLTNSLLEGSRSAVYVMRGQATVRHNVMFGFDHVAIDFEHDVDLKESDNLMFPAGGCRKYYMTNDFCGCPEDLPAGLAGDDGPAVIGWAGLPEERHDDDRGDGYIDARHTHSIGVTLSALLFWRAGHDDRRDELGCLRYHNNDHHYLWPR